MSDKPNLPYEIGYGKPPKKTQFPKGKSGNNKGRPPGSKNIKTEVRSELKARIDAVENGKRKRISKSKAIAKQLVNKAVTGDPKAISILLNEENRVDATQAAAGNISTESASPEDQLVLASIVERIRQGEAPSVPSPPPEPLAADEACSQPQKEEVNQ